MNFPVILKIDYKLYKIVKISTDNYDVYKFNYGEWIFDDNIGEKSFNWYIENNEELYVSLK